MAISSTTSTHSNNEFIFDESGIRQLIKNIKTGIRDNYKLVSCPHMLTTSTYNDFEQEINETFPENNSSLNWKTKHYKDLCLINTSYPSTAPESKRYTWINPINLQFLESTTTANSNQAGTFNINYNNSENPEETIQIKGFENGNFSNKVVPTDELGEITPSNTNYKSITTNIINADLGAIDKLQIEKGLDIGNTASFNLNGNLIINDTTNAIRPGYSTTPIVVKVMYNEMSPTPSDTGEYNYYIHFSNSSYTYGNANYLLAQESSTGQEILHFADSTSSIHGILVSTATTAYYKVTDKIYIIVDDDNHSTLDHNYIIVTPEALDLPYLATHNDDNHYNLNQISVNEIGDTANYPNYGFYCYWNAAEPGDYYTTTACTENTKLLRYDANNPDTIYHQKEFYYKTNHVPSPAPGVPGSTATTGEYMMQGSIVTFGGIAAGKEIMGQRVHGAVFNDYAEYRHTDNVKPGHCVIETGQGDLILSTKRLQLGGNIVSDTFGFSIGQTDYANTPIAVSGRVLAYTWENRELFQPGDAVCSAPNGTISKMTRDEIRYWPDAIVGYVSEIPQYTHWGSNNIEVDNRIWIKI